MRIIIALLIILSFIIVLLSQSKIGKLAKVNRFSTESLEDVPKLQPFPVKVQNFKPPSSLSTRSTVVIDAKTGIVLFEKEPNLRHLPASTTKLMTALVALEKCSPGDIVTVKTINKDGTQMGLELGDKITVENLLYGMLINSGNDAAYALATSCAGSLREFTIAMNQKAKELGMTNTKFDNPAGFDSRSQFSTAKDLAKLAKVAVANPLLAKIVSTQTTVVNDTNGTKTYLLENVNKLLGQVEGLEGIKTGQTEGSLEILLSKTTRNGNTIIIAILGSEDRFGETKSLIDWTYQNYNWQKP
ncbi:D-alanyl-D-alanine carboxypeptidase [Candidatus Curtissbacteria bacterium]|nr:D-alanyl-D-alanine carboxypeptidase [Candidatus Curtissbacteria bacterium]